MTTLNVLLQIQMLKYFALPYIYHLAPSFKSKMSTTQTKKEKQHNIISVSQRDHILLLATIYIFNLMNSFNIIQTQKC